MEVVHVSGGRSDKKKRREKKLRQWLARKKAPSIERFKDETRSLLASAGTKAIFGQASGPKVSERILELVQPYQIGVSTEESLRKLMETAVIAWNIALEPAERHSAAIEELISGLHISDAQVIQDGRRILTALVRRKLDLFPDDRRLVLNDHVDITANGFHFDVITTELPEKS